MQQQGCSEAPVQRSKSHHHTPEAEWSRSSLAERLIAKLRDVGEVYRESEEELAVLSGRPLERVSGTQSVGIRLDEETLTLRSQVTDLLCSWAGLVVSERRLPASVGREVPALLHFLSGHVRWLAEHPAAQDLDAELSALLDSSRARLEPQSYEVSLGVCCHPGCTAGLQATLSGTGHTVYSRVACDAGHTVPPKEWLLLSGRARTAPDTSPSGGAA